MSKSFMDKQFKEFLKREMHRDEPRKVKVFVKYDKNGDWEPYTASIPHDKEKQEYLDSLPVYAWKDAEEA